MALSQTIAPALALNWRVASPHDDATIAKLCLALYAEDRGPEPMHREQVRRTLATLRAEPMRGRAVVLEIDGQVGGYALLISFWSNEFGGELCAVDELYVEPRLRGRGYGSGLLQALARGGAGSIVALGLEVSPDNARARALYGRLGFRGENMTMRRRVDSRNSRARNRNRSEQSNGRKDARLRFRARAPLR